MKLNLKITTLIFLICFLFQNSYSQQNLNGWYWSNGQPQTNLLKWVKIIDATHMYAVGERGLFMKSSDGGDTWVINSQAGVPDNSFGEFGTLNLNAAWFFDSNTGIVGGSQPFDGGSIKILRTTDGGDNFSQITVGSFTGFSNITNFYFINSTTGYLCGNAATKAYKTTDAGLTWTALPNIPGSTSFNFVYAKDEDNIFLGAESDGASRRIIRTTNGGTTWIIDNLPGTVGVSMQSMQFLNANTGFVGGVNAYFATTTDGGSNWVQYALPSNQMGQFRLQIVGSTVYSLGSYTSIFKTTDLGATWDILDYYDSSNVNQMPPFLMYWMDINGTDMVVVGLDGALNVSNDGGASWRNKNYSVSPYFYSGIYAQSGNGNIWAGGNGESVLHSANGGSNWTFQRENILVLNVIRAFSFVNSTTGYCVGGLQTAGTTAAYKTTNGGTNWTSMTLPTIHQNQSVDFIDANTGWVFGGISGSFGSFTIAKTTNGGSSWALQPNNTGYSRIVSAGDMADINNGYCVSGNNVFRTTNSGTIWNKITTFPNTSVSLQEVIVLSPANVFVGGNFPFEPEKINKVYKTINAGLTWDSVDIPSSSVIQNPSIFAMDWVDQYNGIVTGTSGYTVKTSNGGINWTVRNTGGSSVAGVDMTSKDTAFCVSDRNGINQIFRLYDNVPTISVNVTMGIQGFWNGTSQVSDTAKCYLRSASSFAKVDSAKAVLGTWGYATFIFNNAPTGSYYIQVGQRNSIETWSLSPLSLVRGGVSYNYDFTTAASKAFGNNLILKSGRYCNYSGDVNQDGAINLTDVVLTYNASTAFASGYVPTDVNGDNVVNLTDVTIVYNNAINFVAKKTP